MRQQGSVRHRCPVSSRNSKEATRKGTISTLRSLVATSKTMPPPSLNRQARWDSILCLAFRFRFGLCDALLFIYGEKHVIADAVAPVHTLTSPDGVLFG